MKPERIDFISSYCDRWCERCAFTDRCAVYACQVAIAMCGDAAAGLELAIGDPQATESDAAAQPWIAELDNASMSPAEERAVVRDERTHRQRVDAQPLSALSHEFAMASFTWIRDRGDTVGSSADPILAEAIEVATHDAIFIAAKVHRALDGHDRWRTGGEDVDADAVQNDWNGSAKVALLSIERSHAAWQTIADAARDSDAGALADRLGTVRRLMVQTFPRATEFVRPGFDEPWRMAVTNLLEPREHEITTAHEQHEVLPGGIEGPVTFAAHPEARVWLRSNRNPQAFAANKFHTTARALEFVEQLYAAGATEVLIDNILDDQLRAAEQGPYADTLIIRCGSDRARAALFGICEDAVAGEAQGRVDEAGGAIEVWWD